MYKAIKEIGGYSIGDVIPDRQAEVWLEMYTEPHVEKVKEVVGPVKSGATDEKSEKATVKAESSMNDLLDDYLGRNQSVVKKNISEDKLNKNQLKELLRLEESDKKRPLVINAIDQRLKSL